MHLAQVLARKLCNTGMVWLESRRPIHAEACAGSHPGSRLSRTKPIGPDACPTALRASARRVVGLLRRDGRARNLTPYTRE